MDFARKQLEKYGWTEGKGLGKNENGISEALKPKLKRSSAGIGHDAAADFTEHWWKQLYDKAASNVQVEEENGTTKKIKTKDDKFKITNSTYQLTKKDDSNNREQYDFFVKTAVLSGNEVENVREESESEEEEKKDVFKMTDEELFAACEGRTAHKGARHGLKATGKLARIERQEQLLLSQPQYSGYSHAKKLKEKNIDSENDRNVVEDTNLGDGDTIRIKKKKKKRKHCTSLNETENYVAERPVESVPEDVEMAGSSDGSTSKKSKRKSNVELDDDVIPKKKKIIEASVDAMDTCEDSLSLPKEKKKKKKKDK